VWWSTPVIPALGRWRQKDGKFEASLGYIVTHCLKQPKKIEKQKCFQKRNTHGQIKGTHYHSTGINVDECLLAGF
jgi:hypothetical protein